MAVVKRRFGVKRIRMICLLISLLCSALRLSFIEEIGYSITNVVFRNV
jgi:hypothetical protein